MVRLGILLFLPVLVAVGCGPTGEDESDFPRADAAVCEAADELLRVLEQDASEVPAHPFVIRDAWQAIAAHSDHPVVDARARAAKARAEVWRDHGARERPTKEWDDEVDWSAAVFGQRIEPTLADRGDTYLPATVSEGCASQEDLARPVGEVGLPADLPRPGADLAGIPAALVARVREQVDQYGERSGSEFCLRAVRALGQPTDGEYSLRHLARVRPRGLSVTCSYDRPRASVGVVVTHDVARLTMSRGEAVWLDSPLGPMWFGRDGRSPGVDGPDDEPVRGTYAGVYDVERGAGVEVLNGAAESPADMREDLVVLVRLLRRGG